MPDKQHQHMNTLTDVSWYMKINNQYVAIGRFIYGIILYIITHYNMMKSFLA